MAKKTIVAVCLLLMGIVGNLAAKVYIYIDSPATSKFPIAISHFKNLGSVPDTQDVAASISAVIAQDLEISGLFRLINPDTFLESPDNSGISSNDINWRDWSSIGAEALVKGGYSLEESRIMVESRLFDVIRGSFLSGKRYSGKPGDLRLISHKFSDEVIYRLTGQKGVFQTQIAFVSDVSGSKEIYLMDFDGQNRVKITSHRSIVLSPEWSPDGEKLIFTSYRDRNPDVFMRELFYGKEKKISHYKGLNIAPDWSPDGKKIILTLSQDDGNSDIYIINPDGEKVRRLTRSWANDVSPCWSPDGKKFAFVSNRSGNPQIYIMEVKTGKVRRVTFEGKNNTSPAWSPRGDKIAFTGGKYPFDIYSINIDGSGLRQLTYNSGSSETPSWSPDGRHVVFSSSRGGKKKIYIIRADGSGERAITWGKGNDTDPCWSPYLTYR
jgi:TolB protein